MKHRLLTNCAAFLLVIVLCVQTAAVTHAASIKPEDVPTKESVLEVLRQYGSGAYHIMKSEVDSGLDITVWWTKGQSLIDGLDTAVLETFGMYATRQYWGAHGESIYVGDGKKYDVDYSVAYEAGFTKTEEMAKEIPSQLRTFRYSFYLTPGSGNTVNKRGVFGLLERFAAYGWGLEAMNSLAPFLTDTDAGPDSWRAYVRSIVNDMTAYAEFKYWTLRYMLYVKSANPALYQAILDNENYCAAYRDVEEKFASEIARSEENLNNSVEYLNVSQIKFGLSCLETILSDPSSLFSQGLYLDDYKTLMAEMERAEYREMDSILKAAASRQPEAPANPSSFQAVLSPQKLTVNGAEVNCEKYNIGGSNYFKLRDVAFLLRDSAARFSVDWDEASRTVSITSGRAYAPDGSELVVDGVDKSGSAVESRQAILANGAAVSSLSVYNIGGNNYFKLRDLAGLLGFEVGYIQQTDTATIAY